MKAIQLTDYGSVDNFRVADVPKPSPKAGEVLVKVAFAGLRWGDIMARHGDPVRRFTPPFEWVPGQEITGTIEEVGPDVKNLKAGDRVFGMPMGGGYAEYSIVRADRIWPLAAHVPLDAAMAYPVNMKTAWFCIYPWGKVKEGEKVLIHSAAGGVGQLMVQILKRKFKNVTVIGLVGSEEKKKFALADGADHVINYRATNYVDEVDKIVGPKPRTFSPGIDGGGVDLAINGVRGATLKTDPMVIRKRGRWVLYGHSGDKQSSIDGKHGDRDHINTMPYAYDGITIMPFSNMAWIGQPEQIEGTAFTKNWMETEKLITPTIYPLEKMAEAQKLMEDGKNIGKIVFKV